MTKKKRNNVRIKANDDSVIVKKRSPSNLRQ